MGPSGKTGAKGDKGEKAAPGVVPERNWKQCAWKKLNDDRDFGLIKVGSKGAIFLFSSRRWFFSFTLLKLIEMSTKTKQKNRDVLHHHHH